MKPILRPHNQKLADLAMRDLEKSLSGIPSSYVRVTLPLPVTKKEVRTVRRMLDATQRKFAEIIGVSLETVKAWEAGKRTPEGPATKLIRLLEQDKKIALTLARI